MLILIPVPADAVSAHLRPGPVPALRQIAFQLERAGAPTYRVRAFRRAAQVVDELPPGELAQRIGQGTLRALPGIGATTAEVIEQAAGGQQPAYLAGVLAEPSGRGALGDAGGTARRLPHPLGLVRRRQPAREMAEAARDLGHDWIALTDHSPRLTVARGLSAERLVAQLDLVEQAQRRAGPFRILTGIEVDILEDGSLDQREDLLARLDVVVASVHSKLRMDAAPMTGRMLAAVRNPLVDVLGHCTGRLLGRAARGPPGVAVRRRGGIHGLPGERHRGRDQLPPGTPGSAGAPARAWRWRWAACSPSTPTRTLPASSTGWATAASGPSGRHHAGPGDQHPARRAHHRPELRISLEPPAHHTCHE